MLFSIRFLFLVFILSHTISCSETEAPPPFDGKIIDVVPASGGAQRRIRITSNSAFSTAAGGNVVKINSAQAFIVIATADVIEFRVPNNATTGPITVTADGNTMTGPIFTFIPIPTTVYHARYKRNGTQVSVSAIADGLSYGNLSCPSHAMPDVGNANFTVIFCPTQELSAGSVETLKGTKAAKTTLAGNTPGLSIAIKHNDQQYSTHANTGGVFDVTITDVKYRSSHSEADVYEFYGTFTVDVSNPIGGTYSLTEGEFIVALDVPPMFK